MSNLQNPYPSNPQNPYPSNPQNPYPSNPQNPYPSNPPYALQSSIAGPLKVIAIIHYVLGGLAVVGAIALFAVGAVSHHQAVLADPDHAITGSVFFFLIGAFVLLLALFQIVVGYGLMTFQGWGRVLAIILSCLNLLSFPFGTALGGFTLYFLLRSGAAEEYKRLELTRRAY